MGTREQEPAGETSLAASAPRYGSSASQGSTHTTEMYYQNIAKTSQQHRHNNTKTSATEQTPQAAASLELARCAADGVTGARSGSVG